jgi:hypothetical protein
MGRACDTHWSSVNAYKCIRIVGRLNVQERRHLKDMGANGSVMLRAGEHCAPPRALFV